MYNSHKDPNFSLALNILDGCMQVQRVYRNKDKIGQDINAENASDMFRCAYQLADQMHKEAVAGLYFELAPILFLRKTGASLRPDYVFEDQPYFDPIRRLSLLPSFISKKITSGVWPLPFDKRDVSDMREDFYFVNGDLLQLQMVPLSFMQDDKLWLCPEEDKRDTRMLDVFSYLAIPVYELLSEAIEGQLRFEFPSNARTLDRWLRYQIVETQQYYIPATLYLLNFFPYQCASYVITRPTTNVKFILDAIGADQPTGDSMEFMQMLFLPLLKYGPLAIRFWIRELKGKKGSE